MKLKIAALALAIVAGAADAKSRKIVEPLDPSIIAASQLASVEVLVSPTAVETLDKLEAIAVQKRADAKLPPVDATAPVDTAAARPTRDTYSTLPFRQMLPLVMEDVTREWGLANGRPVKLRVTVDTVKTANAGMALLLGSSDQLAGMVEVLDPADGRALGSFYIDVINSHGGLAGLALRGSGVRESLAEEFALESSRVLTGRKSKTPKVPKS
ncbi:hypothetical protein [Sandarakinorhabdus sp. DWP1-3-1]|uniref:hypothetical protein n=1 Tax=Sandarakinorhabdus sp. DWP1-3-1 TaxID=2804627 RepID=UPI003CE81CA9